MTFPQNVSPIVKEEKFCFHCGPEVSCFNECCRELELALTPYDVLRLRESLGLSSTEFMERHAIVEFTDSMPFPFVYLGMVDDGRGSCPFVADNGCLVYEHRPGACRTYPVGRGASMAKGRQILEKYVLVKEEHCRGFNTDSEQSVGQWEQEQEIEQYNIQNDRVMSLTQHPKMRRGMRLSEEQADLFITALYQPDIFRGTAMFQEYLKLMHPTEGRDVDDQLVLEYAIEILAKNIFT